MQISDLSKCRVIDQGEPIKLDLTIREKSFAAPEVRINHEATPESDIWSLGVIAFMLATGENLDNIQQRVYSAISDEELRTIEGD